MHFTFNGSNEVRPFVLMNTVAGHFILIPTIGIVIAHWYNRITSFAMLFLVAINTIDCSWNNMLGTPGVSLDVHPRLYKLVKLNDEQA